MINIYIPNNFHEERKYAVRELFSIAGINNYNIVLGEGKDYELECQNKIIVIKDSFFGKFADGQTYLNKRHVPDSVVYGKNQFCVENDIPIIYGDETVKAKDNVLVCGIDIFASVFFMLTRWEEVVITARDKNLRFPAKESLAVRAGFIRRPVVNEYAEMLCNMMSYIKFPYERQDKNFSLFFTHDIDVFRYSARKGWLDYKDILATMVVKKSILPLWGYLAGRINYKRDPYNVFDFFMEKSERMNTKSHFYFMSDNAGRYIHTKTFRSIINEISRRGHIIGFHPDLQSCFDAEKWHTEKERLEKYSGVKVKEGRQHVLQIDIPGTFRIWQDNGMEIDSTLGYADMAGFRCGTGDIFHLFDVKSAQLLKLKERPLIVMEGTLNRYEHLTLEESRQKIDYFIQVSKKYKSPLTILFHNSSFFGKEWNGWKELYSNIGE